MDVSSRRVRFAPGRVIVSGPPLPSVVKVPPPGHGVAGSQAPAHSQAPSHGQGLGIGLAILSGGSSGGQQGGGSTPAFPHTSVLDTFDRADNTVLGSNWGQPLHPGGQQGYTGTTMGISSNQAYNRDTVGANKASSWWSVTSFAAAQEAFFTIGTPFGDWTGVALRCQNVGGIGVKYYLCQTNGASWGINREDDQGTDVALASGAMTAFVAGDKVGGRVYATGANVTIELWTYRLATGAWTMTGTVLDSSANKITSGGPIGIICGNANGSSVGRANDFGGGNS